MRKIIISALLAAGLFLSAQWVIANVHSQLGPLVLGTWTYNEISTGTAIRGNLVFKGLTAGEIYDNKYGEGTFTGHFTNYYHFTGNVHFPNADYQHKNGKIWFNFLKNGNFPHGWTFKGGISWSPKVNSMGIHSGRRVN